MGRVPGSTVGTDSLRQGFRIGDWRVNPSLGHMSGPGGTLHIEPKVMDVLVCLARNPARVTERSEILDEVWGGRAVSDEPLTRCIATLRKALDDDPQQPRFIQTVPKRGYRLVCDVRPTAGSAPGSRASLSAGTGLRYWVLGAAIALVMLGVAWQWLNDAAAPRVEVTPPTAAAVLPRSIAVLPFRVRGATKDDSFAFGMYDEILASLASVPSLERVVSQTSSERYRNSDKPLPEIARELEVASILEGSVRRAGPAIRVNVQLIDAVDDEILWAGTYERELSTENIFQIQNEITREVVAALHTVLPEASPRDDARLPTADLEAYEAYVLGRQAFVDASMGNLEAAAGYFERAIALDPGFADAYVGLANTIMSQTRPFGQLPEGTFERCESLLQTALDLNPASSRAHGTLGRLRLIQWRMEEAERSLLQAIELGPNSAFAHQLYARVLRETDRPDEALRHVRRAFELSPTEMSLLVDLAQSLNLVGRVEEAEATLRRGLDTNPDFWPLYPELSGLKWDAGKIGEALVWQLRASELSPENAGAAFHACFLWLDLDDGDAADRCLDAAEERFPHALMPTRAIYHEYRQSYDNAVEHWSEFVSRNQVPFAVVRLAKNYALTGRVAEALKTLRTHAPGLVTDGAIHVGISEVHDAVVAGYVLRASGDIDRSEEVFDAALSTIQTMNRTRGIYFDNLDIYIHAIRDDRESAVAALREAIDAGWRRAWWTLREPVFDDMATSPKWRSMIRELEEDIARQRQWYRQNAGQPDA